MTDSLRRVVRFGEQRIVHRRSASFEKEKEMDRVGKLAALGAYKSLLVASLRLAPFSLFFSRPDRPTLGCFLYLCLTMVLVDMDALSRSSPRTRIGS